jgi:protein TonB
LGIHGRSRRLLILFGVASVAAHALIFGVIPGFGPAPSRPQVQVLDVVIVTNEPPSVPAAPVPQPAAEAERQPAAAEPPRHQAAKPAPRKPRQPVPVRERNNAATHARPAAPAIEMPAERSVEAISPSAPFVPDRTAPDPSPARAPESERPAATAQLSPPVFNAAYLRNPAPRYPLIARRNGEQGTVTLRVLVARDGTPARVAIEKTSGSAHLDDAALETVRSWRFVPARRGEETIEAWVLVPIVFRLEGAS